MSCGIAQVAGGFISLRWIEARLRAPKSAKSMVTKPTKGAFYPPWWDCWIDD
jgi:hypothetical protein